MKKYLFLLPCLLFPGIASAAVGDNCTVDLTANMNDNVDWSQAYVIRGSDDAAWQRAVLAHTGDVLTIEEGKPTVIQGTGEPNAPVQIFIFSAETNAAGGLSKPEAQGTCFEAGVADDKGFFSFSISPRLMWASIGQDVVIDAFTKLEDNWEQLKDAKTDQNYFIGTHMPTKRMRVELKADEQNCPRLCTQSPYSIGARIRPDMYPEVARSTFPFAQARNLGAGGLEGRTRTESTGSNVITIAKLAPHTFYTLAENDQPELSEFLDGTAQKSLMVETLKRILMGQVEVNSAQNTISAGQPLLSITEDTLLAVLTDPKASPDTKELVQGIKDALMAPTGSQTREQGITVIEKAFNTIVPEGDRSKYSFPTRAMINEVFPASRPESSWRKDIMDILMLWTEDTKSNTCLMPKANVASNFMKAPTNLQAMPIPEVNCAAERQAQNTPGDSAWKRQRRAELGLAAHSSRAMALGLDPVIVVNQPITKLEPVFSAMTITKANKPFAADGTWAITPEANAIEYAYVPTAEFIPRYAASACLAQDDFLSYGAFLVKTMGLPDEAADLIETELDLNSLDSDGYYSVRLAHPDSISKRFRWKGDGQDLKVAPLFFQIREGGCSQVSMEAPDESVVTTIKQDATSAYEIGILK